jgi:hypothetical protein
MTKYIHYSVEGRRLFHGSKVTFKDMDCTIGLFTDEGLCILSDEATGTIYTLAVTGEWHVGVPR